MKMSSLKMLPVLPALLVVGGLMAFSPKANAQWLVSCLSGPGVPCATTADVQATNTQLGYTHTYLTTGQTGGPGGMIALLGGINERLGMITNANDELVENQDLAARALTHDKVMMDIRGSRLPKPSTIQRACVQATSAAGRGGASKSSRTAARKAGDAAESRYDDARPQIQALIDVGANRKDLGTCSASDIELDRAGCQGAAVGDRAGADLRAGSLFDGGKPAATANLTLDDKGFKIGQQVITNIAPLSADKLTEKESAGSQAGIMYTLNYNRYRARAQTATDAMSEVLGFGAPMDPASPGAAPFLSVWGENRGEYETMFGSGTFPETPSERELLRFAVFQKYASSQDAEKSAGLSAEEVQRELLESAAISNRINYAILERVEKQNLLLSALLSHQLDPLTSGQMRSEFSSVAGQRKSDQ